MITATPTTATTLLLLQLYVCGSARPLDLLDEWASSRRWIIQLELGWIGLDEMDGVG